MTRYSRFFSREFLLFEAEGNGENASLPSRKGENPPGKLEDPTKKLKIQIYKFPCGPLETNAILFGEGGIGAAIDPSLGSAEKILVQTQQSGLKIEKILLTHSHWDHIADVHALKEKTGALLCVHPLDAENVEAPGSDGLPLYFPIAPTRPDHLLRDGEIVTVGSLQLEVIHTPGHTPGGVCFYLAGQSILFAGDTLFCGSMGRTDFSTGNAQNMWSSLRKLAKLSPKTRVISGHGPDTEIGKEAWLLSRRFV